MGIQQMSNPIFRIGRLDKRSVGLTSLTCHLLVMTIWNHHHTLVYLLRYAGDGLKWASKNTYESLELLVD